MHACVHDGVCASISVDVDVTGQRKDRNRHTVSTAFVVSNKTRNNKLNSGKHG